MNFNSDINILGGLPDWNIIEALSNKDKDLNIVAEGIHKYTVIKTNKSFRKYEIAVNSNLLKTKNTDIDSVLKSVIKEEGISPDSKIFLFWNASFNNQLLYTLNEEVYFPAYLSGRAALKKDEVLGCINELKSQVDKVNNWSVSLIDTLSSKYLTLLKKFGLMEGVVNKKMINTHLNDKLFILFIYWLSAIENKPNLLLSPWLKYSFSDKQYFIDRLLQKKYSRFFNLYYTGDVLRIEPLFDYNQIYHELTSS